MSPITQEAADMRTEGGNSGWAAPLFLGLHLALVGLFWTGIGWAEVIGVLVLMQLRGFCVSACYHRLLAHRSYKTSRWFQFLLAAGACTVLRGGPLYWAALHRRHHHVSDREEDIFRFGDNFWWIYGGWMLTGKHACTDYRQVRDLARLPELRWLNCYWLVPSLLLALVVCAVFGWSGLITVYATSTVALLHLMAWIDVANHQFGTQRYATGDNSRNNWLVSLIGGGEGWHNNHHHFPVSANLGFFWWETDGTWTMLRLLSRLGLVWDLRTPPPAVLQRNLVEVRGTPAVAASSLE